MSAAPPKEWRLIRCVLFGGMTVKFLSRLARDRGVWTFFYHGSRLAIGDHTRARARIGAFRENEEISILVEAERTDEIVAFCVEQLHLDRPGRGILFVAPVAQAVPFVTPVDNNAP